MEARPIVDILLEQDYITPEDAQAAKAHKDGGQGSAVSYLLQEGIINRSTLGLALAEYYGTSYTDLDARSPSEADLARIPESTAKELRVVYIGERDGEARFATDLVDEHVAQELKALFPGKKVRITYSFPEQIDAALMQYQQKLDTRFAEIVKHERKVAPELFDEIVKDAIAFRASDIHFEPGEEQTRIRFRIDGLLRLAGSISREHYDSVLNRMKIMANLRTDEHFLPQDGAIRLTLSNTNVDLRLSVVPTLSGEKAVIRVLTEYVHGLSLESLGLGPRSLALLEAASHKPFGMILAVGPTGSGKTTMLYALIRKLNAPGLNLMTIEDPVEYRMEDANQIQVNTKTGLTFAKGLRAIVRQDPNVILLGEIRDTETAETAVNAALTGHLLLSTFHANDSATAIPRLLDMGVEPFLLASTLELVMAQRLARRICETCRESYETTGEELAAQFPRIAAHFEKGPVTLYRGRGCGNCSATGYRGRIPIHEMLQMTPSMRSLVETRPSADSVAALARENGTISMFEDGLEKAYEGITTIEEVLRVAAPKEL